MRDRNEETPQTISPDVMTEIKIIIDLFLRFIALSLTIVAFISLPMFTEITETSIYDRGIYVFLACIAIGVLLRE